MIRVAGVDLINRLGLPSRSKCIARVRKSMDENDSIDGQDIYNMLTTTGGFRPHAERTLGAQVKLLAEQVLVDKDFLVFADKQMTEAEQLMLDTQRNHMDKHGLPIVSRSQVRTCLEQLEAWCETEEGNAEQFIGTLKMFLPLHDQTELSYLKNRWASLHLLLKPCASGKTNEGKYSLSYFQEDPETKHFSLFYVPLDFIRDYFGDHVGLYSAWLVLYTSKLVTPALAGLVCFIAQFSLGLDNNWMTVPYSVFLALWSVLFLTMWQRKENELQFLWGNYCHFRSCLARGSIF